MKLLVLALDYDGTIAESDRIDPDVKAAIGEARTAGVLVVLVTGRILADLRGLLGDLSIFDAIVAENGAAISFPTVGRSIFLAAPPRERFLQALRDRGVWARAGGSIVELDAQDAHVALSLIREQQLPLVLLFNRGRVMILPQSVSKATGLREALRTLRRSPHDTLAIGDGENDHELLSVCEVGAAVAWGSPALQAAADTIIEGTGPPAVAAYIRRVLAGSPPAPRALPRRKLLLGRDDQGNVLSLAVRGRNVLIAGDPCSGKSWVAGLLCEQLLAQAYCVCVIDPEGDYVELEALAGVMLLGGNDPPPSMEQLARTLRHADVSVVVDLSLLSLEQKRDYTKQAFHTLAGLRRINGLPHRVVLDEAHYFLDAAGTSPIADLGFGGYTLVTYRLSELHPDVLAAAECILVTRETNADEVKLLHRSFGDSQQLSHWEQVLSTLAIDEAALLPTSEEAGGVLQRFRIAPRLTRHVRHRHKYLDVALGSGSAFQFVADDGTKGPLAGSLQRFVDHLAQTPVEQLSAHARRGDYSRWIGETVRDQVLAETVRDCERRWRNGELQDLHGALTHAIHGRYGVVDDLAL